MNENTLTGFYLNRLLVNAYRLPNGQTTSLMNEIMQNNGNDINRVRARLQQLLDQNPQLLNYSDGVGQELMDTNSNNYQQTASFLSQFARSMGAQSVIDADTVKFEMQSASNRNLPAQIANDEVTNQQMFATLFDRQDFSNPVIRNYFIQNLSNNGYYRINQKSTLSRDQLMASLRSLDAFSQQAYMTHIIDLQSNNMMPSGYQMTTAAMDYAFARRNLSMQAKRQRTHATRPANNQAVSSQTSVVNSLVNRGVSQPIANAQRQASQPTTQPSPASQSGNYASQPSSQAQTINRDTQSIPFGQYEVGAISRDDLLAEPTIYSPRFYGSPSYMANSQKQFEQTMTDSVWDYNNGKYQWRKPDVAANSPVTVQELADALGPFFSTPNMESKFHDLLMDTSGDKRNRLFETRTVNMRTVDGDDTQQAARARINDPKKANAMINSELYRVAREHGGDASSGAEVTIDVLKHNGHLFSPSDVAKAQFILKTAQDAGLDYDIRPGKGGQIVLKVNDNRGMQVTLLDIDNPSNIGSTRDRSGNEYEVDWTNVVLSDGQNQRPVFPVIDAQGRIINQSRLDALSQNRANSQLYSNATSTRYTSNFALANFAQGRNQESYVTSLLNAYNDPNSAMDPAVRNAIQTELQSEAGNDASFELNEQTFGKAVSAAFRKNAMKTYESLPSDYQSFMAAVPMIEALGIDTDRLNSFQELAKKYHYTSDNMVVQNARERLQRIITPTSATSLNLKPNAVYDPKSHKFGAVNGFGINLDPKQELAAAATGSVVMRDSLFVNHTNKASEFKLPALEANRQIGEIYHNARVNILDSLVYGSRSSDDQSLNDLLDRYDQLTSEVLSAHHLSFKQPEAQLLLAHSVAYVDNAVQNAKLDPRGFSQEDYQSYVTDQIDNDSSLSDDQKEAAHDYAEKLYRFLNNETGTAMLTVNDDYDHSKKHVTELKKADTPEAKAELAAMNWYQEYGYHPGDQQHVYLDTLQQFTASQEPNAIRYGFDLVNYAKQTTPDIYQSFMGHNAVNSKLIQQRMVNFDNEHKQYLSQLGFALNPNRYDHERAKNDWMLDQFNTYMLDHNQPIELDRLNEQYQQWLNDFNNIDVTRDVSTSDGHHYTLTNHRIINEDGELIDSLPEEVPADWNKYFAGGKIMNPQGTAEEQANVLASVLDSLEKSQVEPDWVFVSSPGRSFTEREFMNAYVRNLSNNDRMAQYRQTDANGQPIIKNNTYQLTDEGLAQVQKMAQQQWQRNIASGAVSPDIAIDQNGLVHWKGHSLIVSKTADVPLLAKYLHDVNSDDPKEQAHVQRDWINLRGRVQSQPAEGTIGQFFVPDRRFIINTNYHTFDNLTDEEKAAVQDHEVAGWKAVIQAPREMNQRGDLNKNDLANFNSRLVLSSLPQVLRREIDENIRMQTAQLPLGSSSNGVLPLKDDDPLAVTITGMQNHASELTDMPRSFGMQTERDRTGRIVSAQFSSPVLQQQMQTWFDNYVLNNGDNLSNEELNNLRQMFVPVVHRDNNGKVVFKPEFMQEAVRQFNHTDGQPMLNDRIVARRDYTRPEDTTIVNKVYSQEMASTKIKPLPNGQTIFDADNNRDQEIRNKSLLHLHARYRINNGPGEATSTRNVLNDMAEIEQAVKEWQDRHPGVKPYSTPDFAWEIKNRVHSRVQFFGGTNLGVLATEDSLGYADLISTSQGKAQGRVRFLPEGSIVLPSGHVVPAEVPVPMTDAEKEQVKNHQNTFATMTLTHVDLETGEMKTETYKMSRFLDGTQLTKDKMFKYLSTLPFDRSFIAIEQAAKANYIDQDATLALLNANLMNMEDGSVVSKAFAQKHQVYTPDGKLRPLEPGDKLSDTSGDKTTITQVIDPEMSVEEAERQGIGDIVRFMKQTNVDIIKSPLSQISRKNMSQVQDMIDSFARYNKETVKIPLPKRVEKAFVDANGTKYQVGDLMPQLDENNYPVTAQPSAEERAAGLIQKPILTDWADHRKSIAELKKENDNWLKFMNEGGPKAFSDGHKFVDVDGNEVKSWPSHPVFAYTISKDSNGNRVFDMKPALAYQMSDQTVDTGATIGNVTSFVTDILVDAKGNNYGIDPDATTEGRKYSDLVANADASRNATALTQYLTSVDSDALPDFREYLKLAGFELSPDGKVFAANIDPQTKDTMRANALRTAGNSQSVNLSSLNDLMDATHLSENELQTRLHDYIGLLNNQADTGARSYLQKIDLSQLTSDQANVLYGYVQADQKFEHDFDERMKVIDDQINHPGEHRDVFTVDDLMDPNEDSTSMLRAIQDANTKTNTMGPKGAKYHGVWDVLSPLPPLVGSVDDPTRNAHVVSSHQILTGPASSRLDYKQQVLDAMQSGQGMQRFNSAEDAMKLYLRPQMVGVKTEATRQKRVAMVKSASMLIHDGKLSKEQLTMIGPVLDKIGIDMSDLRSSFGKGFEKPGVLAVPDLNGVQQKNYYGQDYVKILQQMNPGKGFMEMIEGSNGGSLELPDGLTVSLQGNPNSHTISILPQDLRRSRQSQANGTTTIDDYTRDYAQIGVGIKRYQVAMNALGVILPSYPAEAFTSKQAYESYRRERSKYLNAAKQEIWSRTGVQEAVDRIQDRMMTSTFGKDAGTIKKNFIRERIMSNRVKSSSTAVQSNGYNLPIDTIEVSPTILKSLGMKYDPKTGYAYSPNPDDPNDRSWDMVHMHRDPVWRAHGSLGFRVKVNPSITGVRISPIVVSLMDGDFDGDTIGLIACADEGAQKDLHNQVNVLANVYDQSNSQELGSTDMNVSGELIDLAGRSNFKMNMASAFGGRMPGYVLEQTGTEDADWQFGALTQNVQNENGRMITTLDPHGVAKLYAMAQKLYPNDKSLQTVKDDAGKPVNILEKDANGQLTLSKVAMDKLNAKKALKTYYALGLDVANKEQQHLLQQSGKMPQAAVPQAGKMQWRDYKNITNVFVNNTNHAIRTGNDARLAGAGINAKSQQTAKDAYAAIVDRGAKGSPDALAEMFSDRYINNKPLYNPQMQEYADQVKAFRDRVLQSYPDAIVINKNGNVEYHLEKIANAADRKSFEQQFSQLQQNYLKPEDRKFFDQIDKDTAKELANLAMVQDATKEKSDLTGEPGGWHKKLVAAMADRGPEFLAAANALGYKMTQATLQVKHDPVLAHKLADLEVNGMSKVYAGQYETRPLMLGLVGSNIVKSGPNLIVPLGNNTMTAGVNQRLLFDYVDKQTHNAQRMKALYPDDPTLTNNDFSFHRLSKEELQQVAKSLAYFAPQDADGHKMNLDNLSDEDAIRLAEGFDQATRPMLSTWDPKTGEQLDSKKDRYTDFNSDFKNLTEQGLRDSMTELFNAGGVGKPSAATLDYLVTSMTQPGDGENPDKIIGLTKAAQQNAGTMMYAKSNGFDSIRDSALENTKNVLSGNEDKTTSIFSNDQIVVTYQTRKQRIASIEKANTQTTNEALKYLQRLAKAHPQTFAGQFAGKAVEALDSHINQQGDLLYAKRIASAINQGKDKNITASLQAEKDPNGPLHQVAQVITVLGNQNAMNAQKLDTAKNSGARYVTSMRNYVLSQNHINPKAKDWKAAAAKIGYSDSQIKSLAKDLKDVETKAAKQFENKPLMWEDKQSKPATDFMNQVFTPMQFGNGNSSAEAVRRSQQEFANNPAVMTLLDTNKVIMQAVKKNGMTIGGLQRVADGNHNLADQVKVAKHNCQRIVDMQLSDDKTVKAAFRVVSKSVSESDALGKFAYSNRFSHLLRDTINNVSLAQKQLAVDPTIHSERSHVDSQKISADEMADFRRTTSMVMTKMALTKDGKKNQKIIFSDEAKEKLKAEQKLEAERKAKKSGKTTEKSNDKAVNNTPAQTNQAAWYNRRNNDKTFGD